MTDIPEEKISATVFAETAKNKISDLAEAADAFAEEHVKERVKTHFFKNNRKLLRAAGICAVGITIQVLRKKTKTQGAKIELLEIENQFLHFVISGLSNPEVNETEFGKEIAKRANYVQVVAGL